MVDARKQIKRALEGIESDTVFKVKMQFPQSVNDGEMITYFELLNQQTYISVVDEIAFQVDVWAYSMAKLCELAGKASDVLTDIGLKRQFVSPDILPTGNGGYFRKTMRFGRKVDTRTNRLID